MAASFPAAKCGHYDINAWKCNLCVQSACKNCAQNGLEADEDADEGAPQLGPRESWWRCDFCGTRTCDLCDPDGDEYMICSECDAVSCNTCDRVHFIEPNDVLCDAHSAGFCDFCDTYVSEFFGECMDCRKRLCETCEYLICEVDGCNNRSCLHCGGIKHLEGEEPEFVCEEHIAGYCDECGTFVRKFFGNCDGCNTLLCYNCNKKIIVLRSASSEGKILCATCPITLKS